jgi:NADP-dependent 3-hydroxy acid dehydrogenase YdfG
MRGPEVVVITGASAGVGRATVRRFAADGARVALLSRGVEGLEAAAREVEEAGGRALPIAVDVADADQVFAAAERIEHELGPIDVWINDAMTTVFGRVLQLDPAEYRRVTDVTYHGMVHGTMAALEHMVPRDRGTIVQVGSALAYRAIPLQSAYCGAKHACRAFTDSLRSELIHDGLHVHLTMVHLPGLNTPQFEWCRSYMPRKAQPVPPIFQPDVAARAIHYAAHHRRREIYVGLPTLKTVWGQKVAPGFLDHYLASKAFDGQMTNEPDGAHASNLFEPVEGDRGARGAFDDRAKDTYAFTALSTRAGAGGVRAGGALFGVAAIAFATLGIRRWLRAERDGTW